MLSPSDHKQTANVPLTGLKAGHGGLILTSGGSHVGLEQWNRQPAANYGYYICIYVQVHVNCFGTITRATVNVTACSISWTWIPEYLIKDFSYQGYI